MKEDMITSVPYKECFEKIKEFNGKLDSALSDRYNLDIYILENSNVIVLPSYGLKGNGTVYKSLEKFYDVVNKTERNYNNPEGFKSVQEFNELKELNLQYLKEKLPGFKVSEHSINGVKNLERIFETSLDKDQFMEGELFNHLFIYIGEAAIKTMNGNWYFNKRSDVNEKVIPLLALNRERINLYAELMKEFNMEWEEFSLVGLLESFR